MMYNTKLNEFAPGEIDPLIHLVEEKISDLNYKISALEYLQQGDVRHDLDLSYNEELNVFILWKVQLLNAKEDIKEMNKIIDN